MSDVNQEPLEELRVTLGEVYPEAIAAFCQEMDEMCAGLLDEAIDGEQIKQLAHRIKGTAGAFGATLTSQLAAEVEKTYSEGGRSPELVYQLAAAWQRAKAFY